MFHKVLWPVLVIAWVTSFYFGTAYADLTYHEKYQRLQSTQCPGGQCPPQWIPQQQQQQYDYPPIEQQFMPRNQNGIGMVSGTPGPSMVRVMCTQGMNRTFGSGCLIDIETNDDTSAVLTCRHVLDQFTGGQVTVLFPDGRQVQAVDYTIAKDCDAAIIFIPKQTTVPLQLASDNPPVATPVWSSGYGPDGNYALNRGLVNGYNSIHTQGDSITISGGARQGDSGGPMRTQNGEVVGVLIGTDFKSKVDGTNCRCIRNFIGRVKQRFANLFQRRDAQPRGDPSQGVVPVNPAQPNQDQPRTYDNNPDKQYEAPSADLPPEKPRLEPRDIPSGRTPDLEVDPPQIETNPPSEPTTPKSKPWDNPVVDGARSWIDGKLVAVAVRAGVPGIVAAIAVWFLHRKIDKKLNGQPSLIQKIRTRRQQRKGGGQSTSEKFVEHDTRIIDKADPVTIPRSSEVIRQTENYLVDRPLPEREAEAYRESIRRLTPQYGNRTMQFGSAVELIEEVKKQIYHGNLVSAHTPVAIPRPGWKAD